ncbi:MAG: serine/threonine protein kinase [Planctomycetes bacterium]|nr:serine/threonine protein kinase [Planctomycetota bacterium]
MMRASLAMRFAHFQFDPEKDRLGEGPSSEVFRAVDLRLGRTVALKILRPHVEFDPQAKQRFDREAKHTSNLAHANIATVYEYGQDRGTSFIAMEFLEGRTLDKVLKVQRLEYEEGLRIALQVAGALKLVHERGLIHRDLKPANIMVLDGGAVKLLDFGICRSTGESSITQEGMLVGTVLYMSPEQVLSEDLSTRSDVFSLGSVFYHAFTGELPFPGKAFPEVCMAILDAKPKAPSLVRPGFPPRLEEFLLRCLEREKDKRYPHAGAVYGALAAIADNMKLSSSAERPSAVQGKIVIQPFRVQNGETVAKDFASSLRKDLRTELARSTQLDVDLADGSSQTSTAFVLRGTLDLTGTRASIDYVLERALPNGRDGSTKVGEDHIERTDEDEWALQATLVGQLVRSVKKKLSDYANSPPPEEKRDPLKADELARRAHEVLHRGTSKHLMAAVSTFRQALQEDPNCVLAHAGLGEALVRKFLYWDGDVKFLQEARDSSQRALSFDPFSAEAHTSLGFASQMSGGDSDEAQREYRLAIQIDHEEWLAHRLLGALLGRLGNHEAASPLLQRAIALRPTHIGSYDHLYGILCRLDRYTEAIEIADRGIAAAKKHLVTVADDQEARLHMAMLLARMGLGDDARAVVVQARTRSPKDAYTSFHSACVHALLGEIELALTLLKEAQERGFYLRPELSRNSDLELLRGRREFALLMA